MKEKCEMQLKVMLARTSSEKDLVESVKHLQTLCEGADFWINIINDYTYSATHRRIAFVQYFVRHSYQKKVSELRLGSLDLSSFDLNMKAIGTWAGVMPVHASLDTTVVRITCRFGDAGAVAIYLAIFPKTGDSELTEIVFGRKSDSRQVVTDVYAGEQVTFGAYIHWRRWQEGQVYELDT